MKNVVSLLVVLLVISSICLTSCGSKGSNQSTLSKNVSSNSQSSNSEGNDNNQEDTNTGDDEYTYEPVDFEISASVNFYDNNEYSVFTDTTKSSSSGNKGLVNSNGKVTIEPIYNVISKPSNGYVICSKTNGNVVISTVDGKVIKNIDLYDDDENRTTQVESFSEGLGFISSEGICMCVDTSGNVVFKTDLEFGKAFKDGIAVFSDYNNSAHDIVALNTKGKELWRKSVNLTNTHLLVSGNENVIVYQSSDNNLYGVVDIKGNEVVPCKYDKLTLPGNNKIGFKKYGLWGYMDYDGNEVIKPQFAEAKEFSGGNALVKTKEGDYAIINENGEVQFNCESDSIEYFDNGLVLDSNSRLLDSKGNVIYEIDSSENHDAELYGGFGNVGISYDGGAIFCKFDSSSSPTSYEYFKLKKNN